MRRRHVFTYINFIRIRSILLHIFSVTFIATLTFHGPSSVATSYLTQSVFRYFFRLLTTPLYYDVSMRKA